MISFSNPYWLLLLPPILYLFWQIRKRSFVEGTSGRQLFWFLIRSILFVLVIFALAGSQFRTQVRQNQVIFLVDVSDSIGVEQRDTALDLINRAIRRIRPPDQVGMIAFGSDAAVERFPSSPYLVSGLESKLDGSSTNLENAIRLSEALFAANYQSHVVILTDGLNNAGNPEDAIRQVRDRGISIQAFYLAPLPRTEVGIESVRIPEEIGLKQPFTLDIVMSTTESQPALLQIYRNGALHQEGVVHLGKDSKNFIQIPQQIREPGVYRFEIRLKAEKDYRHENNTREVWISVEGPPRILLIDENPQELQPLSRALQNRGFQVDLKAGPGFPNVMQEMLLYQAIFVRNVPASRIHSQMPLLQQYVREFGGGFAMLGGRQSFGPGGYYHTPVEETLPVTMDLNNKKYLADVAMVLVIDKSGSMSYAERGRQKIDLADEGAARVASLLKASDQLGVLAVDSVPKWAYRMQKLSKPEEAVEAITSIRAGGGGIYVYSGLKEAYSALKEIQSTIKHVILFADTADAEEKEGPHGEPSYAMVRKGFEQEGITTTTIGIGKPGDTDVEYLRQVAALGEGRFYFTNDMFTLPEIFTQESAVVQRYYINEERFQPALLETEPLLSGVKAVPELLGYVATSAKPLAAVSLASPREEPVLSYWRYGLGQSVAFTSDPTAAWGQDWLSWPEYERVWAQITRYLARGRGPANFRTTFAGAGDHTTIIVEALDSRGAFLNGAQFAGALVDTAGNQSTLAFVQTAPGRYEAEAPGKGSLFGKVFRISDGAIAEEAIVQFSGLGGREYEADSGGRERLEQLTGRVLESPEDLRFANRASIDIQPYRDRILWIAVFLLLMDIALRKLDLSLLRFPQRAPAMEAGPPSLMAHLKDRKKQREQKPPVILELEEMPEEPPVAVVAENAAQEPQASRVESSETMQRLKEAKKRRNT